VKLKIREMKLPASPPGFKLARMSVDLSRIPSRRAVSASESCARSRSPGRVETKLDT
jgi:hypothetical protein